MGKNGSEKKFFYVIKMKNTFLMNFLIKELEIFIVIELYDVMHINLSINWVGKLLFMKISNVKFKIFST